MKFIKYLLIGLSTLFVLLAGMMTTRAVLDRRIDYKVDLAGTVVPKYHAIEIPFVHKYDKKASLPFLASAIIDIDKDGCEEVFLGGGKGQEDGLFRFRGTQFEAIPKAGGIQKPDGDASLGAIVLDVNKDGKDDLIVARENGIWLHLNQGGSFSTQKLKAPLQKDTSPLSIAVADINGDGHFDMYVSGYIRNELVEGLNIFNKKGYGGTSALLINRGDNTFEDQTAARGLAYKHNTFQAVFLDVDRDGDLDLVVAHDTGHVKTWRNKGKGFFEAVPNPNSKQYSYPMGIAVGDFNNDGLIDFFFSNVGSTPPHFMVKGDLRSDQPYHWKWIAFQTEKNFGFKDVAAAVKLADYEFAWGAVFEDLNLDGREDLVVSQNFVTAPFHKFEFLRLPGRLFVQNPSCEFAEVGAESGVVNPHYSISPLTADFNGDGYPDIIHANLAGRSKVFLSQKGKNGYLHLQLPGDVSSIGAIATITLDDGKTLTKPYVSGEGLSSDSSRIIIAGLGMQKATKVKIDFIGGKTLQQEGSFRNKLLTFKHPVPPPPQAPPSPERPQAPPAEPPSRKDDE